MGERTSIKYAILIALLNLLINIKWYITMTINSYGDTYSLRNSIRERRE